MAGVPSKILERKRERPYQPKSASIAGASPAAVVPTTTDIVAGGNLGVTYSTGDITQGAFGTVTSVCNGLVRGFGHPFNLLGKTTYGLSGAETLYIQEDPVAPPFTVANFGPTLGTINQDRYVGVSGPLGLLPTGATVTSILNHGPALRTSQSVVTVQDALAQTTNYALVVNHLRVLDAFPPGAEVQSWTISGHDGSVPFTLRAGNRYADTYDIAGISQWDLPDLVWALGFVPNVTIDTVTGVSTVTDDPSVFRLVRAEQRLDGEWIKLNKDTPAQRQGRQEAADAARARQRERQRHGAAQHEHPVKAAGQRGRLFLNPGFPFPFEQEELPTTVDGFKKLLRTFVRNDQYEGFLSFFSEVGSIERTKKTAPADRVVTGSRRIKVIVE